MSGDTVRLELMTSGLFGAEAARGGCVLLPLASVEQGGEHCPLGADFLVAEAAAPRIARAAGCLSAPAIPYGDALELDVRPGTLSVDGSVYSAYVEAVARSLLRQGFGALVFLCFHSLNLRSIEGAARKLRSEGAVIGAVDWWKAVAEAARGETASEHPFGHCGEVITSVLLALAPEFVDVSSARDEDPRPALSFFLRHGPGSPFVAYGGFGDYCRTGAWGRVSDTASAEKGRRWMDRAIDNAALFIREFLEMGAQG